MNSVGGYVFKNVNLLTTALTHSSFSNEHYERLEFLGDSILDFLVAEHFYKNSKLNEGELTRVRAFYVSGEMLSKIFDKLCIDNFIRVGKSCKEVTKSIKSDMLEAIVGAIYIDSDLNYCKKFLNDNFDFNDKINGDIFDNKTRLQETAQASGDFVSYKTLKTEGSPHNPTFTIECLINSKKVSQGTGTSKHQAEQIAAQLALEKYIEHGENK